MSSWAVEIIRHAYSWPTRCLLKLFLAVMSQACQLIYAQASGWKLMHAVLYYAQSYRAEIDYLYCRYIQRYDFLILLLLAANLADKKWCKNLRSDWNPGTWKLMRVLNKSFPINTKMTGFRWLSKKNLCVIVLWMKVASALEGFRKDGQLGISQPVIWCRN